MGAGLPDPVECDRSGAWKGKPKSLTEKFDASPEDFVFSADGKTIYFTAEDKARTPVWSASTCDCFNTSSETS